jgi:hypothetical protein
MPSDMIADFGHIGRYPSEDRDATRAICARAHDAADARRLLHALGLLAEPRQATPERRVVGGCEVCQGCGRPMYRGNAEHAVNAVLHSSHGRCGTCAQRRRS